MTEGVKFAAFPNASQGVDNGKGRARRDSGAFDIAFRASRPAKPDRADAMRTKETAPTWVVPTRARLEAAIAASDEVRRADVTDTPRPAETKEGKRRTEPRAEDTAQAAIAVFAINAELRKTREAVSAEAPAIEANVPDGEVAGAEAATPKQAAKPQAADPEPAAEAPPTSKTERPSPEHKLAEGIDVGKATAAPAQPAATGKPAAEAKTGEFVAFASVGPADPSGSAANDTESDSAGSQSKRGGDGAMVAKVTVMSEQTIPAPPLAASSTASTLVAGLTGDSGWQNSLRSVASAQHQANQSAGQPLHTMKLQLHPAELGMVTANLRVAGDQMSVELTVENRDAYDRLTGDSDAIVKSLRALGYEIDQVSVQQPQIANNTTGRAEANFSATGNSARDAQAFGSNGQGNGGERLGGQGAGRGRGDSDGRSETNVPASQDRAQRGIYI